MNNLLSLKNLSVEFRQNKQRTCVVKEASLEIKESEIVGLVGESGSGKTISTLAITRLLPSNAQIVSGEVIFEGKDLLKMEESQLRDVRGGKIAYIFQEPTMYLNPLLNVGSQIAEAVIVHQNKDKLSAREEVVRLLTEVAIPSPSEVFFDYPHQLSGGMNQRVMIAQALASNPKLLIADEPTTSLDVDTEREILDLILDLQKEIGFSCLFITHNLGLIKKLCRRVYVMYKGRVVEEGDIDGIFNNPQHEHTKALVDAYLRLGS
jgi:ABC-type dipeptide/oligopeptide/nickel transport system ATPase component